MDGRERVLAQAGGVVVCWHDPGAAGDGVSEGLKHLLLFGRESRARVLVFVGLLCDGSVAILVSVVEGP